MPKVYSKEGEQLQVTEQKEVVVTYDLASLQAERDRCIAERDWLDAQIADLDKLLGEADKLGISVGVTIDV